MTGLAENWLTDGIAGVLSLLFPIRCAGCDRVDQPELCDKCRSLLRWLDPEQGCPRCGRPFCEEEIGFRRPCSACWEHAPSFAQAVAAAEYTDPLSKVITLWKYQDQRYLSDVLAELLRDWVASHAPAWWEKIEAIVPVPHHPKALRARGFSPPEELSKRLSASFALPYMPRVVYKIRHTLPQACLDAAARRMNVHASMKVFDPPLVEGRVLLAVDDVMTTGATLSECARALIEAGASKVYCLALARQSH